VRRVSGNRLDVNTGDGAAGGVNHFDVRIASQGVLVRQGIVVPAHNDGGLTLGNRGLLGNNRNEVSGVIDLLEESQSGLNIIQVAAIVECSGVHAHLRLGRGTRVSGKSKLTLVLRFQQISPILGNAADHIRIDLECHHAVVITIPIAVRVF